MPVHERDVGLCARCVHLCVVGHPRGGEDYVRCGLRDTHPAYPKYPRLPVLQCDGFQEATE